MPHKSHDFQNIEMSHLIVLISDMRKQSFWTKSTATYSMDLWLSCTMRLDLRAEASRIFRDSESNLQGTGTSLLTENGSIKEF